MNKILFLFAIGSMSSLAQANCMRGEEIDLRKIHYNTFQNITIRDQGSYGICYAHAASTLIDIVRDQKKSNKYQFRSDPMAAAILSTALSEGMEIEGGHICDVVHGLAKTGFACGSSGVSVAQVKNFGTNLHEELVKKVFMPYVLKHQTFVPVDSNLFPMEERLKNASKLSNEQKKYLKNMDEFLNVFFLELKLRGIARTQVPTDSELFEFFQSVHVRNSWASFDAEVSYLLIQNNCKHSKYEMPKISCNEYSSGQSDLLEITDDGLKKGFATGASICSTFLANKNYKGTKTNGTNKADCGEHAVVIIGKREQNGFCQYLIRNSWGANARYDWPSSSGDIWVDEFALKANLYEVQVVR